MPPCIPRRHAGHGYGDEEICHAQCCWAFLISEVYLPGMKQAGSGVTIQKTGEIRRTRKHWYTFRGIHLYHNPLEHKSV